MKVKSESVLRQSSGREHVVKNTPLFGHALTMCCCIRRGQQLQNCIPVGIHVKTFVPNQNSVPNQNKGAITMVKMDFLKLMWSVSVH